MGEPILLYAKNDGREYVCSSPGYAKMLLATDRWSDQPVEIKKEIAEKLDWNGLSSAMVAALAKAGYTSPDAVRAMTYEEIVGIEGFGEKAVERIRQALGAADVAD